MQIVPFASVEDFGHELVIGKRFTGSNSSIYFDPAPGKYNVFSGALAMKQSFYVRPVGMNNLDAASIKKGTKFEINLQVDPVAQGDFAAACGRLDDMVAQHVFKFKGELMAGKADIITSMDALKPLHNPFLKVGGYASDGSKYADTIRLKIVGNWATFVNRINTRVVTMRGKSSQLVDSCEWDERDPSRHPLAAEDTRFLLWVRTDEVTGQDVYVDRVKMPGGGYRLIGPQDCVPGCHITPVFSLSNVYFSNGFGATANARVLYIKPRPAPAASAGGSAFTAVTTPPPCIPMLGGVTLGNEEDMEF